MSHLDLPTLVLLSFGAAIAAVGALSMLTPVLALLARAVEAAALGGSAAWGRLAPRIARAVLPDGDMRVADLHEKAALVVRAHLQQHIPAPHGAPWDGPMRLIWTQAKGQGLKILDPYVPHSLLSSDLVAGLDALLRTTLAPLTWPQRVAWRHLLARTGPWHDTRGRLSAHQLVQARALITHIP